MLHWPLSVNPLKSIWSTLLHRIAQRLHHSPRVHCATRQEREIGTVELKAVGTPDPDRILLLALAGRNWRVIRIDWRRHRIFVEPTNKKAKTQWGFLGPGLGSAVSEGMRQVILGSDPACVQLTRRAQAGLESLRIEKAVTVSPTSRVILDHGGAAGSDGGEWWTWAGTTHNTQIIAALTAIGAARSNQMARHDMVSLSAPIDATAIRKLVNEVMALSVDQRPLPPMSIDDARGLKFSEALPREWALHELAVRQVTE